MSGHDAPHDDGDGFSGAATVVLDGRELATTVALVGGFEPLRGVYRWHGRVRGLGDGVAPGTELLVRTGHGAGTARVVEQDHWGHHTVTGVGAPPFPALDEADAGL